MKKIISLAIFSAALLLGLSSCEKFLDEVPKAMLTPENSFVTEGDWNKALTASYAMLQYCFIEKYEMPLNEFGTDEVEPFDKGWAAYQQLWTYSFSADHEFFREHYIWLYDGIKAANTIIDIPETAPVSEETKNLMIAQAKFLRAVFYFELVGFYGGVPLWTSASVDKDNVSLPRSTADAVYELITADMEFAAQNLPEKWSGQDVGRATSGAAWALLGRFYLQWGKSDKALEALDKVIGKYSLYTNYADIFDKENKNQEIENIFEVQSLHGGEWGLEGSRQSSYWGPRGGAGPTSGGFGWGGFGPTQYCYDQYEQNDKRRAAFFITEYMGVPQNPPCTAKYRDPDHNEEIEDDDLNYILIRYADVLLMKAEALNNLGDNSSAKYDCLNEVRDRAGIRRITAADNLSKEGFAAVILKERLLELNCEKHRLFDLRRFGKVAEQNTAAYGSQVTVQPHHVLYPIPQYALDANDAMTEKDQNPGY